MIRHNKKLFAICVFILIIVTLVLSGCAKNKTTVSPKIEGAHDIDCITDTTVDLLDKVVAIDGNGADITPDMQITVYPEVEVKDGYASFPDEGQYKVTYSVQWEGKTTTSSATVNVIARQLYFDYISVGGFKGYAYGNATLLKNGMYNGVYTVSASGSEIAEDLQIKRIFSLTSGVNYTFTYNYTSNSDGRAYIFADSQQISQTDIVKGDGLLTFTYIAPNAQESVEVEISLMLGGLSTQDSSIDFILNQANYSYRQESGIKDLLENFSFAGNTVERLDGTVGSVNAEQDKATLQITSASADIWRGGMFVNTNITLQAGQSYTLSLDVVAEQSNAFEIVIQRDQWNEYKYYTHYVTDATEQQHLTHTFVPTTENAGALWLYIQSGNAVNNISISNISLTIEQSGTHTENIELKDFTASVADGYQMDLTTGNGAFSVTIPQFAPTDWQQQVVAPQFFLAGSGSNFVITFKARATKPVELVFAVPKYGGWDPTLAWSKIKVTEQEQVFTIYCSDVGNQYFNMVWQFGSAINQAYRDVTIEVSKIQISYLDTELDK